MPLQRHHNKRGQLVRRVSRVTNSLEWQLVVIRWIEGCTHILGNRVSVCHRWQDVSHVFRILVMTVGIIGNVGRCNASRHTRCIATTTTTGFLFSRIVHFNLLFQSLAKRFEVILLCNKPGIGKKYIYIGFV